MDESCMGCGGATKKGDRRILKDAADVLHLWRSLLQNELSVDSVTTLSIEDKYVYMCRKCFNSHTRYLDHYNQLISSLKAVVDPFISPVSHVQPAVGDKRSSITSLTLSSMPPAKRQRKPSELGISVVSIQIDY